MQIKSASFGESQIPRPLGVRMRYGARGEVLRVQIGVLFTRFDTWRFVDKPQPLNVLLYNEDEGSEHLVQFMDMAFDGSEIEHPESMLALHFIPERFPVRSQVRIERPPLQIGMHTDHAFDPMARALELQQNKKATRERG